MRCEQRRYRTGCAKTHLPPAPDRVLVCPPSFVSRGNLIYAFSASESNTFVATFVQFGLQMDELWVGA